MARIRVVTDSTSDIPSELREKLNIEVVPLKVHFGNETYADGVTIDSETFFEKLEQAPALPTTSQPSPVDFLEIYKKLLAEDPDTQIISVHISSALSGTFQSAQLAKSLLEEGTEVEVIDSRTTSYGLGLLAVSAAEAAGAGESMEECLNVIRRLREKTKLFFLVDTLEYLQKGGRIGKASALVGSLLHIKPILSIDDEGEVTSVDKIRGSKKAMKRIVELLRHDLGDSELIVNFAHSQARPSAEALYECVRDAFPVKEVGYTDLGPVIGTHVGPGSVAVFATPVEDA